MTFQHINRIMVRAPNWVGDAVMAVPALRELRRIFGDSQITLLARPWVAGLFEGEGLTDNLIPIPDRQRFARKATDFIRDARRLRRERFDLVVLFQNAFGAALLVRAARARSIAGYATDGRGALLDFVIPFEPNHKTTHQVRYYLNIAAELERELTGHSHVDIETGKPRLHVTEDQRERARLLLGESGIRIDEATGRRGDGATDSAAGEDGNCEQFESVAPSPCRPVSASPILALCPGATNSRAKRWPAERFAATADRLAARNGFQTIIVGTGAEVGVANEVAASMQSRACVLAGRTNIADLKAVLSCASLVISNDTGTAHVSAALGVPTVVVFGPTEHISTRPLSDVAKVVRHDVECSPCMLRDCPIDHRCMTRVEVDDIYTAAHELLITAARR